MDGITLEAPAKLNLRLKVTGRRPDGYHELVSVMVPVDLTDRVEVEKKDSPGVSLRTTGLPVPRGEDNLAVRAARAFLAKADPGRGISLYLDKRIPLAAGLGGGSSDAGAVLRAMDHMWPGAFSPDDLAEEAARLGADVPFFLQAVPSLARGAGELLEPLGWWPEVWYVLVKPPIAVSTAWVYNRVKIELTTGEYDYIFTLLKNGRFSVADLLENDLERVTETAYPIIGTIKEALREAGAAGALMTGSGPTVFGAFTSPEHARGAGEELLSRKMGDVFVVTNWLGGRRGLSPSDAGLNRNEAFWGKVKSRAYSEGLRLPGHRARGDQREDLQRR